MSTTRYPRSGAPSASNQQSQPETFALLSQNPTFVRDLFASISRRYDLANHLLSGGIDFLWRRTTVGKVAARQPSLILDLATGSGDLAKALLRKCSGARVVGADFCLPMLQEAQKKQLGTLVGADGMQLPFAEKTFDAVTVAFGLRNMADWKEALQEMRRVTRPGGQLAVLDFSLPSPPFRAPYRWYLHRILPRLAGWITGEPGAYEYLGGSIEEFPHGTEMIDLLERAGWEHAQCIPLTMGIASLYLADNPG